MPHQRFGDVTLVTSCAFMNRLVAIDFYKRTNDPATISPMVISGTHALDICLWCLAGKTPVEVYARSIDKVLGPLYRGIDATAGRSPSATATLYHLNLSWALPVTWRPAVYSLAVGIIGTTGALTIDDTDSEIVLAVSKPQLEGYNPDAIAWSTSWHLSARRHGARRIARADGAGNRSWLIRVALGLPTASGASRSRYEKPSVWPRHWRALGVLADDAEVEAASPSQGAATLMTSSASRSAASTVPADLAASAMRASRGGSAASAAISAARRSGVKSRCSMQMAPPACSNTPALAIWS